MTSSAHARCDGRHDGSRADVYTAVVDQGLHDELVSLLVVQADHRGVLHPECPIERWTSSQELIDRGGRCPIGSRLDRQRLGPACVQYPQTGGRKESQHADQTQIIDVVEFRKIVAKNKHGHPVGPIVRQHLHEVFIDDVSDFVGVVGYVQFGGLRTRRYAARIRSVWITDTVPQGIQLCQCFVIFVVTQVAPDGHSTADDEGHEEDVWNGQQASTTDRKPNQTDVGLHGIIGRPRRSALPSGHHVQKSSPRD